MVAFLNSNEGGVIYIVAGGNEKPYQSAGKVLSEQFAPNLELLNEDGDFNYVAYLLFGYNNS